MSKIFSDSPAMPQEKGSSMSQGTSTGSGSRPTKGMTMTPSSAPTDPHGLGRKPAGALK